MSQIEELQSRITAALDRIGAGVEGLGGLPAPAAEPDTGELDTLRQQLEDEKLVNAQLEERLKSLRDKQERAGEAANAALGQQRAQMEQLDADLQRLRKANAQLRENNQALREANQAGVAEPHLINKSMLGELEALRAARAADSAEVAAVLGQLGPLIAGASVVPDVGDAIERAEEFGEDA